MGPTVAGEVEVVKVSAGDFGVFATRFDTERPASFRLAYPTTSDAGRAEDVVAASVARSYETLGQGQNPRRRRRLCIARSPYEARSIGRRLAAAEQYAARDRCVEPATAFRADQIGSPAMLPRVLRAGVIGTFRRGPRDFEAAIC